MVIIMEIWDRLDEVIGSGLLTSIAMYSIHMGLEKIATGCVGGIIVLLGVKSIAKAKGGDK